MKWTRIGISAVFDGIFYDGLQGQWRQTEKGIRNVVFDEQTFSVQRLLNCEIGTSVRLAAERMPITSP